MAIANINTETGIRYGVISAYNAHWLLEEIYDYGENLTYQQYEEEKIKEISSILEDKDIEALKAFIQENCFTYDMNVETEAKNIIEEELGANSVYDRLGLNELFECDECEYGYEDPDGNQFLLGYLGGSPLIWCIKTNTIVYVKSLCSPCVPNAGDLDSGLTDEHNGYACYGVPTQYLENEE